MEAQYKIDISSEIQGGEFQDIFINNRYIPLETNEESLIGNITKLYISTDRIYVMDQIKTRSLFVFDKNGNFKYKISRIGNGPGEYMIISDFFVDEQTKKITLLANGRKIIQFDYNGNFISEHNVTLPHCSFILPLKQDKFALVNLVSAEDKFLVYLTDKDFKIKNKFIENPEGWERIARLQDVSYSGYNSERYLFTHVCSTVIYELNNEGVYPKYQFLIPSGMELNKKIVQDYAQLQDEDFVMKTFNYFSFDSFFELKNQLFVEFSIKDKKYRGLFNKDTNAFSYFSLKNATSKSINPVYLTQIDENKIAGYIEARQNQKYDSLPGLKIQTEKEYLNPVIVVSELKE
jgi:ribosomal protein S17E